VLALFYSSVISMGVAYIFWYRGLRVLGPTRTAVYSNLQPIVAPAGGVGIPRSDPHDLSGRGRGDDRPPASSSPNMRLVLFDIDGTLLNSGGMGRASMQRALGMISVARESVVRYDGKTDKQIVRDVMRLEGHTDEHIRLTHGEAHRAVPRGTSHRSEGWKVQTCARSKASSSCSMQLEPRKDVVLGLLTGNVGPASYQADRGRTRSRPVSNQRLRIRSRAPSRAARNRATTASGLLASTSLEIASSSSANSRRHRVRSLAGARAIGVASGHYTVEQLQAQTLRRVSVAEKTLNWCSRRS